MIRTQGKRRGMEEASGGPVAPGGPFWRIYALRMPSARSLAKVDDEITMTDTVSALETYRSWIRQYEDAGHRMHAINLSRLRSMQEKRGVTLYSSNMEKRVGRGRIMYDDPRLYLDTTKAIGQVICTTWPHYPSFGTRVATMAREGEGHEGHIRFLAEGGYITADIIRALEDEGVIGSI